MTGAENVFELDPETFAELEEIAAAIRQTGRPRLRGEATTPAVARLAMRRGLDQLRQELLPFMRAPILVIGLDPGEGEEDDE